MAEPLKNHFGPAIPQRIAEMIAEKHPRFDIPKFMYDALNGYEELDLTPRAWHISDALRKHLPLDYPAAIKILLASLGPPLTSTEKFGMGPFMYLPHVYYVARFGVDHFEESMQAQYEITQRFSAEYSIRIFLEKHQWQTLSRLKTWTNDPSPHVRRLVSEGTRPRLPWAPRLKVFQKDPAPVLALLELLKDDPDLYVRRSVANNLNDIGKDHPQILAEVARRWLHNATPERRWLVTHALRSSIKRGDSKAIALMGFGEKAAVRVRKVKIVPARAKIGSRVSIEFELQSTTTKKQRILVDYRVHFVKSSGSTSAKVFKLATVNLAPKGVAQLRATLSLRQMTTRRHFKGIHKVDLVINGIARKLGSFRVI